VPVLRQIVDAFNNSKSLTSPEDISTRTIYSTTLDLSDGLTAVVVNLHTQKQFGV